MLELISFLGHFNYHGHCVPNVSTLLQPLHLLLHSNTPWKWSSSCTKAFKQDKWKKTISPNVVVHYNPDMPIRLAGDASAYGIGAVISHVMG